MAAHLARWLSESGQKPDRLTATLAAAGVLAAVAPVGVVALAATFVSANSIALPAAAVALPFGGLAVLLLLTCLLEGWAMPAPTSMAPPPRLRRWRWLRLILLLYLIALVASIVAPLFAQDLGGVGSGLVFLPQHVVVLVAGVLLLPRPLWRAVKRWWNLAPQAVPRDDDAAGPAGGAWRALVVPIGGGVLLLAGVTTAVETAALAVVAGLVLAVERGRGRGWWCSVYRVLGDAATAAGAVLFVVAAAMLAQQTLPVFRRSPAATIANLGLDPLELTLVVALLVAVLASAIGAFAAVLLMLPIFLPAASASAVAPEFLLAAAVFAAAAGMYAPLVGIGFTSLAAAAGASRLAAAKAFAPAYGALLIVLALIFAYPTVDDEEEVILPLRPSPDGETEDEPGPMAPSDSDDMESEPGMDDDDLVDEDEPD